MNSLSGKLRANSRIKLYVCCILPLLVGLGSIPARATLGENVSSIANDQAHLKASVRILPHQFYTIHELHTPAGTTIRQFVSPAGTVFGVAWQGTAPDLRQLLGDYFNVFMAAATSPSRPRERGFHLQTGDLVIDVGGHMRFVSGRALLRSELPQGVVADEIR